MKLNAFLQAQNVETQEIELSTILKLAQTKNLYKWLIVKRTTKYQSGAK